MDPCVGNYHLSSLTHSQLSALQEMETPDPPTAAATCAIKHLDNKLLIEWGAKVTSWPKLYNFLLTSRFKWVQKKAENSLMGTAMRFLKQAGLKPRFEVDHSPRSDKVSGIAVRRFNAFVDLTITVDPTASKLVAREIDRRAFISALQEGPTSWPFEVLSRGALFGSVPLQDLTKLSPEELQSRQLDECELLIANRELLQELYQKSGWTPGEFAEQLASAMPRQTPLSGLRSDPGQVTDKQIFEMGIQTLKDIVSGLTTTQENLGEMLGKAVVAGLEAELSDVSLVPVYRKHPQFSLIEGFGRLRERAKALGKEDELNERIAGLVRVQHRTGEDHSTTKLRAVSMDELAIFTVDISRQVSIWEWQAKENEVTTDSTRGKSFYDVVTAYFAHGAAPVNQQDFAAMTSEDQLRELQPLLQKKFPLLQPDRIESLALRPGIPKATIAERLTAMRTESGRLQEWVTAIGDPRDVAQAIVRTLGPKVLQSSPTADKAKLTTLKAIVSYSKQKLEPTVAQTARDPLHYQRSVFIAGITSLLDKEGLAGFGLEGLVTKSLDKGTKHKIREHCLHAHGHDFAKNWCAKNSQSYEATAPFVQTLLESFQQVDGNWPKKHTLAYVDALLDQSLPLALSHELASLRIASQTTLLNLQRVDSQKQTERQTLALSQITPLFQQLEGPRPGYTSVLENIRQQPGTATKVFLTDFFAELLPGLSETDRQALQEALTKVAVAIDEAGLTSDKVLNKLKTNQRQDLLMFVQAAIRGKPINIQNAKMAYDFIYNALGVNIARLTQGSGSEPLKLEELSPPGNVILPGLLEWVKTAKAYQKDLRGAQATGNKVLIQGKMLENYVLEDNLDDLRLLRKLLGNRLLIKTGGMLTRFGITKSLIEKFIINIVSKLPMPEKQLKILLEAVPAITSALAGLKIDEPGTQKTLDDLQGMVSDLLGAIESNENLDESDLSLKMLGHIQSLAGDVLMGSTAVFAGLEAVARMPAAQPSVG